MSYLNHRPWSEPGWEPQERRPMPRTGPDVMFNVSGRAYRNRLIGWSLFGLAAAYLAVGAVGSMVQDISMPHVIATSLLVHATLAASLPWVAIGSWFLAYRVARNGGAYARTQAGIYYGRR